MPKNQPKQIENVGVTGSRVGMTDAQRQQAEKLLVDLDPVRLHHGDCVGVDHQMHQLARQHLLSITVHPPDNPEYRAWCEGDQNEEPLPYLTRDRVIVRRSRILLGFPSGPERLRSGTWATIRFAVKDKVPVIITYPDGRQEMR